MYPVEIFATLLFLSGVTALITFFLALPRVASPGGRPLVWMMAAMTVWSWTYALYWILPAWPAPSFWLDATYLGVLAIPMLVFFFALQITQHWFHLTKIRVVAFLVEPLVTLVLLWTDSYHHLFYGGTRSMSTSFIFTGGPWFWVNVIYSYTLFLLAYFLLFAGLFHSRGQIYRKQIAVSVAGLSILFVVNILGLFGFYPLPGLDLTPILFSITGVFFAYSLLAFQMLDVIPVAKNALLDQMNDGVIVLDHQQRVVEINFTAASLMDRSVEWIIGKPYQDIIDLFPNLHSDLRQVQPGSYQIETYRDTKRVFDVAITALSPARNRPKGYLISLRDITRLKQVEIELRQSNEALTKNLLQIQDLRNALEEQIIRDPLTGLFNRRFLQTVLPGEFARAERLGSSLAFLVIDLDHFKDVNDQFGHSTGDQVLWQLSRTLEASIRKGDWGIRLGGEEFLIIMSNVQRNSARQRAEQLRQKVAATRFQVGHKTLRVTVSIGIALFQEHGREYDEIFQAADKAMYQAKAEGRNRVTIAGGGL